MAAMLRGAMKPEMRAPRNQRVAIIGSGPAGLSAAHDLALLGFQPVIFERETVPAGMLATGIPAYRLPREVIQREVDVIRALGVDIRCGVTVGRDISFAEIRKSFDAVILAVGAKASRGLGLPGESGPGVLGGVDLLRAVSLGEPVQTGRDVVVIGGGNVAYDVARTVLRQIAIDTARTAARLTGTSNVRLVSLESLEEMPADTVEIMEGDEEGIERLNGWGPIEILRASSGEVSGIRLRRCLRVYDENRRFSPVFDDSDQVTLDCDTVMLAVGQSPQLEFLDDGGADIEQFRPGWPKTDAETLATTARGVFAAGDIAHGTRLLIDAVASGKKAARSVFHFLTGKPISVHEVTAHLPLDRYRRERGYESIRRVEVPSSEPHERLGRPDAQVELGYTRQQAIREASRCLDCGVTPVFDGARCVLCGGCADVCPTLCLKLTPLSEIAQTDEMRAAIHATLGEVDLTQHSAILKDEDRCIRCAACAMRCPVDAISMERVAFNTLWSAQGRDAGSVVREIPGSVQ
jgi:NADPH-dependent glutamate synthase beta subunit-like oxidoreductase